MEWSDFQEKVLPLLKLYRDDYILLQENFFEDLNLNQPIVFDIINWLPEKPNKNDLDYCVSKGLQDPYLDLISIVETSSSFDEVNKASKKLFYD